VPDHHPPAAAILLCQLADVVDEHSLGRVADIEVQVDVDIVFAGKFEYPADLAGGIGVVSWRAADHLGPAFERLDQELVSTG